MKLLQKLLFLLLLPMVLQSYAMVYYTSQTGNEYTPTKVSYTLTLNESFASGTTIDRDIITLTFGEAGGPDFLPAMENPIDDTFVFYTQGNGINGHQEKGTFYFFTPTKNGLLTIGIRQNKNKMLYIEEDGIVMPDFNGIICSEEETL